ILLAQSLSVTRLVPPRARVPHVVGRIDRGATDRAELIEPLLFALRIALALLPPALRFATLAVATADERCRRDDDNRAPNEQRDIDAEHDVCVPPCTALWWPAHQGRLKTSSIREV